MQCTNDNLCFLELKVCKKYSVSSLSEKSTFNSLAVRERTNRTDRIDKSIGGTCGTCAVIAPQKLHCESNDKVSFFQKNKKFSILIYPI